MRKKPTKEELRRVMKKLRRCDICLRLSRPVFGAVAQKGVSVCGECFLKDLTSRIFWNLAAKSESEQRELPEPEWDWGCETLRKRKKR